MSVATQNNIAYKPHRASRVSKFALTRREAEFHQFIEADYMWLVDYVSRIDVETLSVKLKSGQNINVKRSINFLEAPSISIDGDNSSSKYTDQFSPALTCIKWLMMILYVT
jgi:hypothetical protein